MNDRPNGLPPSEVRHDRKRARQWRKHGKPPRRVGSQEPMRAERQENNEREELFMAEKMFMRVDEVASALDISTPYAYKLIRKLN